MPKKWTLFSAVAFFGIGILMSQNAAPGNTWDSILSYMLSLMGILGLFMLVVQMVGNRRMAQNAENEKTRVRADNK